MITIDSLNSLIKEEKYWTNEDTTLMICALTLNSNFTQLGRSYAIDKKEFNESIGKELAKKDALNHLLKLEGFSILEQ